MIQTYKEWSMQYNRTNTEFKSREFIRLNILNDWTFKYLNFTSFLWILETFECFYPRYLEVSILKYKLWFNKWILYV